jgi:hypothetical protein
VDEDELKKNQTRLSSILARLSNGLSKKRLHKIVAVKEEELERADKHTLRH